MKTKRCLVYVFVVTLLVVIKLNWFQNIDPSFLSLNKCPSCYGLQCENISSELKLVSYSQFKLFNDLLNVKNVYYGQLGTIDCVLKKLAHTYELNQFDDRVCSAVNFTSSCDVGQALSVLVQKHDYNVTSVVKSNTQLFKHSEVIKCDHNRILPFLFEHFHEPHSHHHSLQHFITLLAINPEPLIMKAFQGVFPFPRYLGACGRIMIEEFVGNSLSYFHGEPWTQRARLALQLIRMADAMTNNEIRIYLTDPSSDNFAVDGEGTVKMIDLENVVLVDSKRGGLNTSFIHLNKGFGCPHCFSYDYQDLCYHFKADHNYFAVCKGLLSSRPFSSSLPGGLLHTIPEEILKKDPNLSKYIEECAQPNSYKSRIEAALMLSRALSNVLQS